MFELGKVDREILQNMLRLQLEYNKIGLSVYDIRRKAFIASGNWDSHKNRLSYFQLISTSYKYTKKPHKGKTRSNFKRKLIPTYYVTDIGFLTLMQNLDSKKVNDYLTVSNLKFVPTIANHLSELQSLDLLFPALFKYALSKIDIKSVHGDDFNKKNPSKDLFERQLRVKITLSFLREETEISVFKNFLTLSNAEQIIVNHKLKNKLPFRNYDELFNNLSSNFSFLFYFYLIMLKHDDLFALKISLSAVPKLDPSTGLSENMLQEIPYELRIIQEVDNEFKHLLISAEELTKKYSEKLDRVIQSIREDPEIKKLFRANLDEIDARLLSVDYLDFIHKYVK